MRLMRRMREAINNDCFDKFVVDFVKNYYKKSEENNDNSEDNKIPNWIIEALGAVNIKFG